MTLASMVKLLCGKKYPTKNARNTASTDLDISGCGHTTQWIRHGREKDQEDK
jgi:hypothetical protein